MENTFKELRLKRNQRNETLDRKGELFLSWEIYRGNRVWYVLRFSVLFYKL